MLHALTTPWRKSDKNLTYIRSAVAIYQRTGSNVPCDLKFASLQC